MNGYPFWKWLQLNMHSIVNDIIFPGTLVLAMGWLLYLIYNIIVSKNIEK